MKKNNNLNRNKINYIFVLSDTNQIPFHRLFFLLTEIKIFTNITGFGFTSGGWITILLGNKRIEKIELKILID